MNIKEVANEEYYNSGEPILSDHEFDLLGDDGLEIKNFRTKTDHLVPMGSLKKIKDAQTYNKWLESQSEILVSPKIDGNSIELVLEDGEIIQAITRGDGFVGNDVTDKVQHCNLENIQTTQTYGSGKISIKCEAVMPKVQQQNYDKNIRNVVAGLLGSKHVEVESLKKIDLIDFSSLQVKLKNTTYELLESIFTKWKSDYKYEIDGVVVTHVSEVHQEKDVLLPENKVALKFNKDGVEGEIGEIEWNLGKYGRLTPVLILKDGIDIDGTTVKRVSASNYGLLKAAGLWPGAKVKVIKSGDIIPFISEVVEKSTVEQVVECPICGATPTISENGIHAICENCSDDKLIFLKHVFGVFDLEFISGSTVESLYLYGYTEIEDFFNLTQTDISSLPGFGTSKAANIVSKLKNLELSEAQILKCCMVEGLGEKQCQKLIEYFGSIENLLTQATQESDISSIEGFGPVMAKRVFSNIGYIRNLYTILSKRVNIKQSKSKQMMKAELNSRSDTQRPNVVFTGKCELYGRKELTALIEDYGYNVQSSVNKETNLLITSDSNSGSSKTKKAIQLGVKIVSYDEFFLKKFPEFLI